MPDPNQQPISKRQNSEQQRGRQAWENIQSIKDLDKNNQEKKLEKEYRSLARGLNAMIQINGLGQTLGFLKAKGKDEKKGSPSFGGKSQHVPQPIELEGLGDRTNSQSVSPGSMETQKKPHYLLLLHLTTWMQEPAHFKASNNDVMKKGYDGLLRWVTDPGTSSDDYRRATTECLAFGVWLRRFAEGELKEPDPGEDVK
jgi:CRISPR-associated protein Cmr5